MLGGGKNESAVGGSGVGGAGKGASGAATIFGNNGGGEESGNVTLIIAALAGLVLVGLVVFLIVKK